MTNNLPEPTPKDRIRTAALALGFEAVGFTSAALPNTAREGLKVFVEGGYHGDMAWMETRMAERGDPQMLWPAARSILCLGMNYGPSENPLSLLPQKSRGAISAYAQKRDYHDVLKKRQRQLASWIAKEFNCEVKIFIDTAPVMEKPLAQQAGIGWQGKHTNLVSRQQGSWLFLAEIFMTLELEADAPETDHCGACTRCIDICPTRAIIAPGKLDARKCIAYLTIEHKGPVPHELRPLLGNRIYGCDDCLSICPWNKFATPTPHADLQGTGELWGPQLSELALLDDAAFRTKFSGSPVKRIGRNRFVRNVLNAIGNSGDRGLLPVTQALSNDADEVIREAAEWACRRLAE